MRSHIQDESGRILCYLLLTVVVLGTISGLSLATWALHEDGEPVLNCESSGAATYEEAQDTALAQETAANHVVGNFRPSLEMKEKMDFLLTPAFLVQQTISDGVVLTYPEE